MRRPIPWTSSSTGAPREAKGGNKEVVRTADLWAVVMKLAHLQMVVAMETKAGTKV